VAIKLVSCQDAPHKDQSCDGLGTLCHGDKGCADIAIEYKICSRHACSHFDLISTLALLVLRQVSIALLSACARPNDCAPWCVRRRRARLLPAYTLRSPCVVGVSAPGGDPAVIARLQGRRGEPRRAERRTHTLEADVAAAHRAPRTAHRALTLASRGVGEAYPARAPPPFGARGVVFLSDRAGHAYWAQHSPAFCPFVPSSVPEDVLYLELHVSPAAGIYIVAEL
jgi:hypothetical protein